MGQPAWRRAFDQLERAVGKPLEDASSSPRVVDLMVVGFRTQVAVTRVVKRTIDKQTSTLLHAINVPTHSDVQRISRQLATLTAEVRSLAAEADRLAAQQAQPSSSEAE